MGNLEQLRPTPEEEAQHFTPQERAWFAEGDVDELMPYMAPEVRQGFKEALRKAMEAGGAENRAAA